MVAGVGIPTGSTILSIGADSVTISNSVTVSNTGTSLTFSDNLNGVFNITSTTSNTFTYNIQNIANGSATVPGNSLLEKSGLSNNGSTIFLTTAVSNSVSRITGSYLWDLAAAFVQSANLGTISQAINAGSSVKILNTNVNNISTAGGYLIFDFGLTTQEGPVRYLYRPTDDTIALDPSYVFQFNHSIGSAVGQIDNRGPHIMSGTGAEYAPYITDPSQAIAVIETLIKSVKSAGIFINFLIRFPEQFYALYNTTEISSSV